MSNRFAKLTAAAALLCVLLMSGGISQAAAHANRSSNPLHLLNSQYLTVGTDATYPPMESRNTSTGQIVGADVDLANALAKAMGLKGAKMVDNTFSTIIPALTDRHRFDVIMSSMNDTPLRAKVISFVDYMKASEAIVVNKSSNIHANGYAGVCGKTVAVENGTTELDGLNAANKACQSKINIKSFAADTDAFNAFASGHADAYTGDLPVALLYVKMHSSIRLAGKPFGAGEDYGIGLQKSNHALKSALQKALTRIRKSGKYFHILLKWGVEGARFKGK
jgi:polar amino acid transport system substrate-binding protein